MSEPIHRLPWQAPYLSRLSVSFDTAAGTGSNTDGYEADPGDTKRPPT